MIRLGGRQPIAGALLQMLLLELSRCPCGSGAAVPTALDPVAVCHVRRASAADGRWLEVRTLSVEPAIFLVPGLLDEEEADELVALAKQNKEWKSSIVLGGDRDMRKRLRRGGKAARRVLREFDDDRDGNLSAEEMQHFADDVFTIPNYDHAAFVRNVLGEATPDIAVPIADAARVDVGKFFDKVVREEPHRLNRFSRQTWLKYEGKLPRALLGRAGVVTELPEEIVNQSEDLQVVHYSRRGHYACHHDSAPDSIDEGNVRIGTLAMFLNNVTSGGETVFPGALRTDTESWGQDEWSMLEHRCQRTEACTQVGGLKVTPKKGDGIFWYNVQPWALERLARGPQREGFGERAVVWNSLHCAAEVLEGEKWFANLWLQLPDLEASSASEL